MYDVVNVDGGDDDDALLLLLEELVLEDGVFDVVINLTRKEGGRRERGEEEEGGLRHHIFHLGQPLLPILLPFFLTPPASSMQDSIFLWSTPAVFMASLMHLVSVKRDRRLGRGRGGGRKGEGGSDRQGT